jgi:hypothetical protein
MGVGENWEMGDGEYEMGGHGDEGEEYGIGEGECEDKVGEMKKGNIGMGARMGVGEMGGEEYGEGEHGDKVGEMGNGNMRMRVGEIRNANMGAWGQGVRNMGKGDMGMKVGEMGMGVREMGMGVGVG